MSVEVNFFGIEFIEKDNGKISLEKRSVSNSERTIIKRISYPDTEFSVVQKSKFMRKYIYSENLNEESDLNEEDKNITELKCSVIKTIIEGAEYMSIVDKMWVFKKKSEFHELLEDFHVITLSDCNFNTSKLIIAYTLTSHTQLIRNREFSMLGKTLNIKSISTNSISSTKRLYDISYVSSQNDERSFNGIYLLPEHCYAVPITRKTDTTFQMEVSSMKKNSASIGCDIGVNLLSYGSFSGNSGVTFSHEMTNEKQLYESKSIIEKYVVFHDNKWLNFLCSKNINTWAENEFSISKSNSKAFVDFVLKKDFEKAINIVAQFVRVFGTHVISGIVFGGRKTIKLLQDHKTVEKSLGVSFGLSGSIPLQQACPILPFSAVCNAKNESEYKNTQKNYSTSFSCVFEGGSFIPCANEEHIFEKEEMSAWENSISENMIVVKYETKAIVDVLKYGTISAREKFIKIFNCVVYNKNIIEIGSEISLFSKASVNDCKSFNKFKKNMYVSYAIDNITKKLSKSSLSIEKNNFVSFIITKGFDNVTKYFEYDNKNLSFHLKVRDDVHTKYMYVSVKDYDDGLKNTILGNRKRKKLYLQSDINKAAHLFFMKSNKYEYDNEVVDFEEFGMLGTIVDGVTYVVDWKFETDELCFGRKGGITWKFEGPPKTLSEEERIDEEVDSDVSIDVKESIDISEKGNRGSEGKKRKKKKKDKKKIKLIPRFNLKPIKKRKKHNDKD